MFDITILVCVLSVLCAPLLNAGLNEDEMDEISDEIPDDLPTVHVQFPGYDEVSISTQIPEDFYEFKNWLIFTFGQRHPDADFDQLYASGMISLP